MPKVNQKEIILFVFLLYFLEIVFTLEEETCKKGPMASQQTRFQWHQLCLNVQFISC
jgi:integral membrane sensor domain MASE1